MTPPQTRAEIVSELLGRLDTKLDTIDEQIKAINQKLYGNGKPGLLIDQERMMNQIDQLIKIAATNAGNIGKLQNEIPAKWIVRNWKSLLLVAMSFFVLLHSFIPADVSIWTWLSKLFGG